MASKNQSLGKFSAGLIAVAKVMDDSFTVERFRMLELLHRSGETDQEAIGRQLGLNPPTTSRNIRVLSDIGKNGAETLNLVSVRFDPADMRRRLISLTRKGEKLFETLEEAMSK